MGVDVEWYRSIDKPEGQAITMVEEFAEWATLGINTAFVSETLAAQTAFRDLAGEHGIATFVIVPVFFDPEALEQDPDLFAVTADGTRAEDDWVQFVCCAQEAVNSSKAVSVAPEAGSARLHGRLARTSPATSARRIGPRSRWERRLLAGSWAPPVRQLAQ